MNKIAVNMPISRACSPLGIPRRSYYARKPVQFRINSSRVLTCSLSHLDSYKRDNILLKVYKGESRGTPRNKYVWSV